MVSKKNKQAVTHEGHSVHKVFFCFLEKQKNAQVQVIKLL